MSAKQDSIDLTLKLPYENQIYIVEHLHKQRRFEDALLKTSLTAEQRKLIKWSRLCRFNIWAALNDAGLEEEVVFFKKSTGG